MSNTVWVETLSLLWQPLSHLYARVAREEVWGFEGRGGRLGRLAQKGGWQAGSISAPVRLVLVGTEDQSSTHLERRCAGAEKRFGCCKA
jgi:hypothetical protein